MSFRITGHGRMPCRLVSVFALGANVQVSFSQEKVVVHGNGDTVLSLMLSALHPSSRRLLEEASLVTKGQFETLKVWAGALLHSCVPDWNAQTVQIQKM